MTVWQRIGAWFGWTDRVTAHWLAEQDRDTWRSGVEGVNWTWPVKK